MKLPDDEWTKMKETLDLLPQRALVVEIGCFEGGTTQKIAEYIKPKKGRVIAVDPHKGSTGWVATHKSLDGFMKNAGILDNVIPVLGTSLKASTMGLKPDFVFIDGDHSYQACLLDCKLWKNTTPIIAFHDTLDKTVWKAIQEEILSSKHWDCEITNSLLICKQKKAIALHNIKIRIRRAYYLLRRKLWKIKTKQTQNPLLRKSPLKSTPAESSKSQAKQTSQETNTTNSSAHTSTKQKPALTSETNPLVNKPKLHAQAQHLDAVYTAQYKHKKGDAK